jgi:hypothetical protein
MPEGRQDLPQASAHIRRRRADRPLQRPTSAWNVARWTSRPERGGGHEQLTGSEKAAAHRLGLSHSTGKHHLAKRAVQSWGGDDGAARVDPGAAAAGAGGQGCGSKRRSVGLPRVAIRPGDAVR